MALPFFYAASITADANQFVLNEDTSKHIVQVLRMQNGGQLQLTDGRGNLYTAEIADDNRKKCSVHILNRISKKLPAIKVTIAISLVKNNTRFEWFLEKATEIGVTEIIPLICSRTEKQQFRTERMKGILISAMLQSQQAWLPELREPVKFSTCISVASAANKLIAHCESNEKRNELRTLGPFLDVCMLIGPEGDFTKDEISLALQHGFTPVALGDTRLRTETAGVVSASLLCLG